MAGLSSNWNLNSGYESTKLITSFAFKMSPLRIAEEEEEDNEVETESEREREGEIVI